MGYFFDPFCVTHFILQFINYLNICYPYFRLKP